MRAAFELVQQHLDRQLEAVADDVGDRLDLGDLVVVRRDEGALLALQPPDLIPQPGDTRGLVLGQMPAPHQLVERHERHRRCFSALTSVSHDRVAGSGTLPGSRSR